MLDLTLKDEEFPCVTAVSSLPLHSKPQIYRIKTPQVEIILLIFFILQLL